MQVPIACWGCIEKTGMNWLVRRFMAKGADLQTGDGGDVVDASVYLRKNQLNQYQTNIHTVGLNAKHGYADAYNLEYKEYCRADFGCWTTQDCKSEFVVCKFCGSRKNMVFDKCQFGPCPAVV